MLFNQMEKTEKKQNSSTPNPKKAKPRIFKLRPKQQAAFIYLTHPKYWDITHIAYGGARYGGKGQTLDSVVMTPTGEKQFGELVVGDVLLNPDGSKQTITHLHPIQERDTYRVVFSDGSETVCDDGHLWYGGWRRDKSDYMDSYDNKNCVKTITELYEHTKKENLKSKRRYFHVPNIKPNLDFEQLGEITIDPYLLGVLLGDGSMRESGPIKVTGGLLDHKEMSELLTSVGFTNNQYWEKNKRFCDYRATVGYRDELKDQLTKLGVYDKLAVDKFIPKEYKYTSYENRLSILQGLLDTDGGVSKNEGRIGSVIFTSTSKQLAEDVAWISRSLGFTATTSERESKDRIEGDKVYKCKHQYTVRIVAPNGTRLFRLERKQNKIENKDTSSLLKRKVVDVIKEEKKLTRCITVSNPNSLYITNDFIVTHNSILGSYWIHHMCMNNYNVRYAAAAYDIEKSLNSTLNSMKEVSRMLGLKEGIDWTFNKKERKYTFLKTNSEVIFFGLPTKSSDLNADWLAGYTFTGAWVDESNLVDRRVLYKFFESCGRVNNSEFIASEDMTDEEKGMYPEHEAHGGFKRQIIPVKILETFNPSHEHIYDRFWVPYRDNTEKNTRFIRATVYDNLEPGDPYIKILENIEDPVQRDRMLNGSFEYNDSPSALFSNDLINDAFDRTINSEIRSAVIDVSYVGKSIDKTTIGLFNGLDLYEIREVKANTTEDLIDSLYRVIESNGIPMANVVVDANGVGNMIAASKKFIGCKSFMAHNTPVKEESGILNVFRKNQNSLAKRMYSSFASVKDQCVFELAGKFTDGLVSVSLKDRQIKTELKQELLMYENLSSGTDNPIRVTSKTVFRKRLGRSPDYSDLLVMRMYLELLDGGMKKSTPLKDRKFIKNKIDVSDYA